jgi:hypothetical protein
VTELLHKRDYKAVCLRISEKFLVIHYLLNAKTQALGTHQGVIYILDFNGNENGRLDSHNGFPVREIR